MCMKEDIKMKIKRLVSIFLSIILILSITSFSFATNSNTDKFVYPIQPGSEKWENLNHGERILALQIPENILKNMSTEELVEAVLDYPCFIDFMFYNTYQEGFEVLKQNFNGIRELFSRNDFGEYLLNKYKQKNVRTLLNINSKDQQFENSLKLTYLETLLAQPEVLKKLSNNQINELSTLVEKNYQMQLKNRADLNSLSFSGYYESLANQQNINLYDYNPVIKTPNGSTVKVFVVTDEDIPYYKRELIKRTIEKNYPGSKVVGDATNRYNCHAFAWAEKTYIWMNDPSIYWEDGSYRLEKKDSPSKIGQKIYYPGYGKEHSGKVVNLNGNQIRSKWGMQSLVEHDLGNCPYFFIPLSVEFYGR